MTRWAASSVRYLNATTWIADWAGGEPTIVAIHGSAGMGHTFRQLSAALDLRRPVLLGHSAGGTVAAFVALSTDVAGLIGRPDRIVSRDRLWRS